MKKIILICTLFFLHLTVNAGDDSSGPIKYRLNLGEEFTTFTMGTAEHKWSASLVSNMGYKGDVVHFVKTSLILLQDGKEIHGAVYRGVEKPDVYYVVSSDSILKIGYKHPYNPGVGGFSMHMPGSRNFIVCLNFQSGGVPTYTSSPVTKGIVTWGGHKWDRFK